MFKISYRKLNRFLILKVMCTFLNWWSSMSKWYSYSWNSGK